MKCYDFLQDTLIHVRLQNPTKNGSKTKTGKLTVTCKDPALASVKWLYYLKGLQDK